MNFLVTAAQRLSVTAVGVIIIVVVLFSLRAFILRLTSSIPNLLVIVPCLIAALGVQLHLLRLGLSDKRLTNFLTHLIGASLLGRSFGALSLGLLGGAWSRLSLARRVAEFKFESGPALLRSSGLFKTEGFRNFLPVNGNGGVIEDGLEKNLIGSQLLNVTGGRHDGLWLVSCVKISEL